LAQRINQALAQCDFSLCKGNIMAGNPELCLSRQAWSQRFARFVDAATPENLLASSIYFDLRVVWGPEEGCQQLRRELLRRVGDTSLFHRMLAESALRQKPPRAGLFRAFSVARKGAEKDTLDLTVQGLTPFGDAARLLALAHGVEAISTLERLRQLTQRCIIEADRKSDV